MNAEKASEKCPLVYVEPGRDGVVWEPGIPDGCYPCINSNSSVVGFELSDSTASTERTIREDCGDDVDLEHADGFYYRGVKIIRELPLVIEVIEESGYEIDDLEFTTTINCVEKQCQNL